MQQGKEELRIWGYSKITPNEIKLKPSFDNSKTEKNPTGCGWHGPFEWSVKVLVLDSFDYRNKITEAFLENSQ